MRRRLACQAVEHRLMEGCLHRDLDAFRTRIDLAMAQRAVVAEAGLVLDEALAAHHRIDPYMEGGSS